MRVVILFVLATLIPLFPFLLWLSRRRSDATPSQVASVLEHFLNCSGGPWDWDDFISVSLRDPALDAVRIRCAGLPEEFPSQRPGTYCSEAGLEVIRAYLTRLREAPVSPEHS